VVLCGLAVRKWSWDGEIFWAKLEIGTLEVCFVISFYF